MPERKFVDVDKQIEGINASFLKNKSISRENKDAVLKFVDYCIATGLSKSRIRKILSNLNTVLSKFALNGFGLENATHDDLMKLVSNIEQSDYSPATKSDFKGILKKYYKYRNNGEYPEKVKFFSTHIRNNNHKLPEDLISRDEVNKLMGECQNSRDKAIIMTLYESGFRIGEFGSLRVKHVKFDKYGVILTAPQGKTGGRRVRLIECERHLRNWLEDHPDSKNQNQYLWVKIEQYKDVERMMYDNIRMMLKKKAMQSGIEPGKVFPHNFRHSRATELANKLTEAQMCIYFGWTIGSDQPATYVHLSGRDVDYAILEMHGLKRDKENGGMPRKCVRCFKENPCESKFCNRCGMVLDEKAAVELDEKRKISDDWMNKLIDKPDVKEFLMNKLKEMVLEGGG